MSAVLALSALLAAAGPTGVHFERSFDEAIKKARAQHKAVMVDFWAEWCSWCHRLDKTTYMDPAVVKLSQDFVAAKVNTEGSRRDVEVAERFDVTSLPTILFVTPGGHLVSKVNGFQGPGKFPRTLERAKEGAFKIMGYEAALEKNPKDATALAALGTHLFEQELFDEARELLQRAAQADAQEPPATRRQTRLLLAIIQNYDEKYADAEALLKEGLGIRPMGEDEAKLLFVLGRTYMKWGRPADARKTMQQVVSSHGQSPMAQKAREQLLLLDQK
jgi:thioredoxin-like negative regulator of GroEL